MNDNALKHHGILGMKWGVRRFQKKDGTLTKAGKTRAKQARDMTDEELVTSVKRMNLESSYNKMTKKPAKLEKTKRLVDASSTLVNKVDKLSKESVDKTVVKEKLNLNKMTDKELRDRINRTNLEKQYTDMFAKETVTISKGKQYADNVLGVAGGALLVTGSALEIALAIKALRR